MRHLLPILIAAALVVVPGGAFAGDDAQPDREAWAKKLEGVDGDVKAAVALALQLEAKGYGDLAEKAYEIVVGIDPDHRLARRKLGFELVGGIWRTGDDLKRAKGLFHHEGRWMTAEEFAEITRPQREAAAQKAGEKRVMDLLHRVGSQDPEVVSTARRELATTDRRFKLAPLARAIQLRSPALRVYAADQLGTLGDPLAVRPLLRAAIHDRSPEVRRAAARSLKAIDSPSTVHPLGRALDSRFEQVRIHAAEALAELGDQAALPYIVKKWEGRSGDFPRSYFSNVRQVSYIQDFDVEVAQTSFIADPIVGVLQEGVVQDVKILATETIITELERVAYAGALKKLSGVDLGNDVKAWSRFWHENGERLLHEREARYRQ
jgi:hypothetical protein